MTPISVCIIAKNEEDNIGRCLSSLSPYGLELIVVDTGSSDRTKEFAAKYTNRIYDFIWTEDFSAARNFSLEKASNDWIFMIDCDEAVIQLDLEELYYFCENLSHAAGSVSRENLMGTPGQPYKTIDRTERFFSRKYYHYTGRIHEQLTPICSDEMENYLLNTTLFHDGYLMTEEMRLKKAERNLSMLHMQLQEEPENPYVYYQLGKGYEMTADYERACEWFAKGFDFALDPSLAYVEAMVLSYGNALLLLGQNEEALSLEAVYSDFSSSADFIYLMGMIYKNNEMFSLAIKEFEKALTFEFSNQEGTTGYLSYYQIGSSLICMGDFQAAKKYFSLCGDYPPAKDAFCLLEAEGV